MYTVNPSYSKISAKENLLIKINYFFKTFKEDLSKHKFKFEAFVLNSEIENLMKNNDLKDLFRKVEDRKEKAFIYSISRTVAIETVNSPRNINNSNNLRNDLNAGDNIGPSNVNNPSQNILNNFNKLNETFNFQEREEESNNQLRNFNNNLNTNKHTKQ